MSREGLPIGIQVIGRPYEEELVLAVAEAIERGRGAWPLEGKHAPNI
jgi:amidase